MKTYIGVVARRTSRAVFAATVLYAAVAGAAATIEERAVGCRVELDRNVLLADRPQTAVIKVTLDAPEPPARAARPPVNLAIVLDHSGSMRGDKMERAKDAAIEALRRLNGRDKFSLVTYNESVETVIPAQSPTNTEGIERKIRQINADGNTALFGGVSQGAAEIRKSMDGNFVHRIILLSDGLANVGPSSPEDLGRLGTAFVKEGISVTTVGVGNDYNEDLMTRLSQNSDGNAYFASESGDLPRIFGAELGDVLSVVAKRVRLTIECPDGVTPLTIVGREGRIRGQSVELSLNQLYGRQQKYALVEVEIQPTADGQTRDIATARVSYEDAITQKTASVSASARTTFSGDRTFIDSDANYNTVVQNAYYLNLNALNQESAILLADEGKTDEAVARLRQSIQVLNEAADRLDDDELRAKAGEVEQQAEVIEAKGMTADNRKLMRTSSYQDKNQQKAR